jgi:hypothetical protein
VSECMLQQRNHLLDFSPKLNELRWHAFTPTCTGLDSRVTSQLTSQNFRASRIIRYSRQLQVQPLVFCPPPASKGRVVQFHGVTCGDQQVALPSAASQPAY